MHGILLLFITESLSCVCTIAYMDVFVHGFLHWMCKRVIKFLFYIFANVIREQCKKRVTFVCHCEMVYRFLVSKLNMKSVYTYISVCQFWGNSIIYKKTTSYIIHILQELVWRYKDSE